MDLQNEMKRNVYMATKLLDNSCTGCTLLCHARYKYAEYKTTMTPELLNQLFYCISINYGNIA